MSKIQSSHKKSISQDHGSELKQSQTFFNKTYLSGRGFSKYGQLGQLTQSIKSNVPLIIDDFGVPAFDVSTGESHTAILNQKFDLMMVGNNIYGQQGIEGNSIIQQPTPIPTFNQVKISQVSCGSDYTFCLTNTGQVFSWGLNLKGQLGLGHYENKNAPQLVTSLSLINQQQQIQLKRQGSHTKFNEQQNEDPINLLQNDEKVNQISCGTLHTIIKTDKNRLLSTGFGETFALGHENSKTLSQFKVLESIILNKNQTIQKLACGLSHSACIIDKKLYLWGVCGQSESLILQKPTLISQVENIVDVKLGDQLSVILNQSGEVYVLGQNIDGQLGIEFEDTEFIDVPQKVLNLTPIQQIFCGRNHIIVQDTQNKYVYGWGSNQYNQLHSKGNQNVNKPMRLHSSEKYNPIRFICGSFHTLCISYGNPQSQIHYQDIDILNQKLKKNQDTIEQYSKTFESMKRHNYQLEMQNQQYRLQFEKAQIQLEEKEIQIEKEKLLNMTYIEKGGSPKKKQSINFKQSQQLEIMSTVRNINYSFEIDFKEIQLIKQISEGGYGLVYIGQWRKTQVAVKMLKQEGMNDQAIKDFLTECKAMEALRHPNICLFLGACTKAPNYSIVLEYCPNGTLWQILQNPKISLTWDEKRRFAIETAIGVHYLHSFNPPILHRDLKSLNLLLDDAKRIKLADFGWTRTMSKQMTGKIGTYQWMAPEVINNQQYDEKSDVFSYGIILWEIASREPPYKNINGLQVSIEVVNNNLRPEIPKNTPEGFSKLIRKCWDKDPNKRPRFIDIIKELESFKFGKS